MLGAGRGGEISAGIPVRPGSHTPGTAAAAVGTFPRVRTARFTGADIFEGACNGTPAFCFFAKCNFSEKS